MADVATIKLDGVEYEIPSMNEMNMGELRIVYRYTGRSLDQLDGAGFDPDVVAAVIHVAIRRVKRDLSFQEIEERVETIDFDTLRDVMGADDDDAVEGDDSGNAPAAPSVTANDDADALTGDGSDNGSDTFPANSPDPSIGHRPSAISAT